MIESFGQELFAGAIFAGISTTLPGLLLCLPTLLWMLTRMARHLSPWIARHLWNRRGVFWFVNGMIFSAQNAGYLFGVYEPLSGWAVGLVLDLLIIVFTQSMLGALARCFRRMAHS